ncbi:MAG: SigB/SigF/SigG family RNA polymerase sigma factor [Firmicutes bacterium]|nr:SigB/SigF/SigG family RNA polymerase sigma factor [Bacillota bacterium]
MNGKAATRNGINAWDKEKIRGLFLKYQRDHDPASRDELVLIHMNLVRYLAYKFANRGESLDDLIQVGSIGLIKAVERFDYAKGAEFSTYATPTIVGEIKRYFRDKRWAFKAPRKLQELHVAINKVMEELVAKLNRSPTISELALQMNVTDEEILEAQELGQAYNLLSLNSEMETDDKKVSNLLDYLGQLDFSLENLENQLILEKAFLRLNKREQLVIYLRFYENLSQREIARNLKISQMHVSRLQRKALEKLQSFLSELRTV